MSLSNMLWKQKSTLLASFHIGIIHGLINTWKRCESKNMSPQEPDLVAGLVLESTPILYAALKNVLSPTIDISLASVFCHQKPQVKYDPSTKSCELGDLLFAYIHTPRKGPRRMNALLFQAKMSSKQPYRIRSGEHHQLRLYAEWPDFEYTRSSSLTGERRSVNPKAPHAGAQYLLIDNRTPDDPHSGLLGIPGTYPVGCCMPDDILYDHSDLANELFNLFIFRTGRVFEDIGSASTINDWSQVVWDIINCALHKGFNRKNSGREGEPRISGSYAAFADGLCYCRASSGVAVNAVSQIVGHGNASSFFDRNDDEPPRRSEFRMDNMEPQPGVSLVLIETTERNDVD